MTITRYRKGLATLCTMLLCLLVYTGSALSVSNDCDPTLVGAIKNPNGYRQRGDRCEGIYWEPHGARDSISVVSYTNGHLPTATLNADPLLLSWATEVSTRYSEPIHVRATSLKAGVYFRMDTTRSNSSSNYFWHTDILRKVQLNLWELGFIASTRESLGGVNWTVYLPVSIGQQPPKVPSLSLILVATTPVNGLDWDCSRIEESTGMPGKSVANGRLSGSFQVLEPILLRIPMSSLSGLLYLEVRTNAVSFGLGSPLVTSVVIRIPKRVSPHNQHKESHGSRKH